MIRRIRPVLPPPAYTGERGEARLVVEDGWPIVEATLGGRPFRFLVDTGAMGHGRIKAEVAEALKLPSADPVTTGDTSGRIAQRRSYRVPELTVAGVQFRDLQMTQFAPIPGRSANIDGVLGLTLFGRHTLTLDYAMGRLLLSRDPLPETAVVFDAQRGRVVFPISIGQETVAVALDTGNTVAPLILPRDLAERLPRKGEPKQVGRAATALSSVDILQIELDAPVKVGGVTLPVTTAAYPAFGETGNLGSRALAAGAVRLDQPNHRLQILFPRTAPRRD